MEKGGTCMKGLTGQKGNLPVGHGQLDGTARGYDLLRQLSQSLLANIYIYINSILHGWRQVSSAGMRM